MIRNADPHSVIISDFKMPDCDGVAFLAQVGEIAPDSVRMMSTGYAQLETSLRAVNEGHVFRFLSKPCPMDVLEKASREGIRQYQLIQTEREYFALKKWEKSFGGLIQTTLRSQIGH